MGLGCFPLIFLFVLETKRTSYAHGKIQAFPLANVSVFVILSDNSTKNYLQIFHFSLVRWYQIWSRYQIWNITLNVAHHTWLVAHKNFGSGPLWPISLRRKKNPGTRFGTSLYFIKTYPEERQRSSYRSVLCHSCRDKAGFLNHNWFITVAFTVQAVA